MNFITDFFNFPIIGSRVIGHLFFIIRLEPDYLIINFFFPNFKFIIARTYSGNFDLFIFFPKFKFIIATNCSFSHPLAIATNYSTSHPLAIATNCSTSHPHHVSRSFSLVFKAIIQVNLFFKVNYIFSIRIKYIFPRVLQYYLLILNSFYLIIIFIRLRFPIYFLSSNFPGQVFLELH